MKNTILRKHCISLIVLILFTTSFFVISSCGGGGGGGTASDTTPPTVSSNSPANGMSGVAVNTSVNVTFSEAMDPATINTSTFTLKDSSNNPVTGTVIYSGMTAIFTPSASLIYSTQYSVRITTGIKDLAGNTMSGEYSWTFTTGVEPDTTPPTVTSNSPANGATGVAVNTSVSVTFSEAMDPATINASTFILKDSGNNPVSGTVTYSGTTAILKPNANFAFSTIYTATITARAKDLAGNSLASDYIWTFTSESVESLTVIKSGTGTGVVTSTPAGINCGADCTETYAYGTEVTLTATPEAGSIFEGFSGGCSSIKSTCTLTLTGDEAVTAFFNTYYASAAGNLLGLNGNDDVVVHQLANSPLASPLDIPIFTIEAWIYPLADSNMLVVADSGYYLMVRPQPLRVELAVMTSTGFPALTSFSGTISPLKLNQWNHVVGMVDNSTRKLQIAVNGELSGTLTMGGTVNVSFLQTFSIGNSYPQVLGDYPFMGRIDEVRLSSVIRYSSNFSSPSLLDPDGATVGLWHFDEAEGSTSFVDSSGNGNTLTGLNGAAAIAGTRPVQASGNSLFYSLIKLDLSSTAIGGPVAIGDFNNDGNNDLATADVYSIANDKLKVLLGNGGGSFGPATSFSLGASGAHPSVAVGDFNKDGKSDLAVANFTSNNISILLGTGTGTFGTAVNYPTGNSPSSIAAGDFNSDGIPDLAVANTGSNTISVYLGTGTGTFGSSTDYAVGASPRSVAVGDFNGDGKLDLAIANSGGNTVSILLGTGAGSFGSATDFLVGNGPSSLVIGDFNNDGKPDIATANGGNANVSILLGIGTGSFGSATNIAVPFGAPNYLAIGDLNGDGALDIAVASGGGYAAFSILLGDGSGSFGSPITFFTESNPLSTAIGDLNGDGKPDLAVGASLGKINIFVAR